MSKLFLENVPISNVKVNPLNPRKDFRVRSKELQEIIKERGWETGITCYKKGSDYIILSGHRRWYAATQLGEKTVPVFVVDKPKTELEELERLGSSQGGKVDWNTYEWARYTFDLWVLRGKCSYRELALKLDVSERHVAERIKVFRYYPHHEIEKPLEENKLTISVLYSILEWIEKLKKTHADIVNDLSEDMIRVTMIQKAEKGRVLRDELRSDKFLDYAEKKHILVFLRDLKMTYANAYKLLDGEEKAAVNGSKFKHSITSLENYKKDISYIEATTAKDAEAILADLEKLELQIHMKKTELEYFIKK